MCFALRGLLSSDCLSQTTWVEKDMECLLYLIEGRGGGDLPNPGMGTIPPIRLDSPFHASSRINSLHTLRRNGSVVIHARAWLAATWLESDWLNLRSATWIVATSKTTFKPATRTCARGVP